MLRRVLRSVSTLAAIVVAYQVYVLLAVPLLEPALELRQRQRSTASEREPGRRLVNKYQRLLSAYFPADHWTQLEPPTVIESGPGMLVLDEYRQPQPGRVELERCALLFFPTPRQDGHTPPRDAVIVEAPKGASLQFDEDFNPARGRLGQIVRGDFPGLITIRSDMHESGSHDDLLLQASNLRMNSKSLSTESKVRFRLGPNTGQGRHLEIRFLEDDHSGSSKTGIKFSGVQSLEVRHDVRLALYLDAESLLSKGNVGAGSAKSPQSAIGDTHSSDTPVEVTCTGSFVFDMLKYVATLDENVEAWQINPTGPSDQLSCQQLKIHFAAAADTGFTTVLDSTARQQREDLRRMKPAMIVATGEPVVMISPSRQAEARGSRVQIKLNEREIQLEGDHDVTLDFGTSKLRAPEITYAHPAEDAGTRVGTFHADGAGTFDFVPNPDKPQEMLHAQWQESVMLQRQNGQPVLSMSGRPRLAMEGRGELIANEMRVYLHEFHDDDSATRSVQEAALKNQAGRQSANQHPQTKDLPSEAFQLEGDTTIVPDRLSARGNVVIDSPQLTGRTHELAAWFRYEPTASSTGNEKKTTATNGNSTAVSDRFTLAPSGPVQESYAIQADLVRLEMALRENRAVPTNLSCDGNVVFREARTRNPQDAPLVLHGQRLTVENIDTGATQIAVLGNANPQSDESTRPPGQRAEVTARGVTLISDAVYVDEATNRAWIEGQGEARLKLDRDLQGNPVDTPYPVHVRWQDGLNFDGRKVGIRGEVLVEGPDDWLRCEKLFGTLSRPVDFGQPVDSGTLELAEIDCRGNVVLDHRSRDGGGPTSHERLELDQLTVDQQSGAVSGTGPGWIRSVHYAAQLSAAFDANTKSDSGSQNGGAKLHFLRVDFARGLSGNLHHRQLTFHRRVRTVYGPIDAWEQELNIDRPEDLPPDAVTVQCEELTVNEDPTARRAPLPAANPARSSFAGQGQYGPIELTARENVRIEGTTADDLAFTATAQRANYNQAKDVFILEGDNHFAASIVVSLDAAGPPQEFHARKITYHRATNDVKADDIRSVDLTPY